MDYSSDAVMKSASKEDSSSPSAGANSNTNGYPSAGDERWIEAIRRATLLLDHDARTAPQDDADV